MWIFYGFSSVLCLLCLCARLFICALWSPAGKGLTSWLSFVVSTVSLSLSHWYPGSGVVLDCIDSCSLHPYLLYLPYFTLLYSGISLNVGVAVCNCTISVLKFILSHGKSLFCCMRKNFFFGLKLYIPVNSYGRVGMVSSFNHTFFLGKLD